MYLCYNNYRKEDHKKEECTILISTYNLEPSHSHVLGLFISYQSYFPTEHSNHPAHN